MNYKKQIQIDNRIYEYTLQIKKVKNLIIKIENNGEIIVSANAYIPQHKIDAFLKEKILWILNKQKQRAEHYSRLYTNCLLQDTFYYFDKKLKILLIQSNKNDVAVDNEHLYVYYKHERESCLKSVNTFIRKTSEIEFKRLVDKYYECLREYKLPYPTIKYRYMKSRWGSCAVNKNTITLNLTLLHYPKEFVEYVVLHELVHFVQPNHSKHFYKIIEYHMPDYKNRIKLSQI